MNFFLSTSGFYCSVVFAVCISPFPIPEICPAQTLQIFSDTGQELTGTQIVNVGEHIALLAVAKPSGAPITNVQWIVPGEHIRNWSGTESAPVQMEATDYQSSSIHFAWRNTTSGTSSYTVQLTAHVGNTPVKAQLDFRVTRNPKPEKFYSDDLLMEYHSNWHAVHRFNTASTRRGDLFLGWHRSQLEYFNNWRSYFGYPLISAWSPTASWIAAPPAPPAKQHPSATPPPKKNFSSRHNLTTIDLTRGGLDTPTEGEYDWMTKDRNRGTRQEFISAGYKLHTETVRANIGSGGPTLSKSGLITIPTWWTSKGNQTSSDPWFSEGCPAFQSPMSGTFSRTCLPQQKRSLADYTIRELGESIESGLYASDFQINYHALGHIAASEDMSTPLTSMRDPIFWGWHAHIDEILTEWQKTHGAQATAPFTVPSVPQFNLDWSKLTVEFSHQAIPEFIRASHISVNGSPATTVNDISIEGKGRRFEFSGFPIPPTGQITVKVYRESGTGVRTNPSEARPQPFIAMNTSGNILTPAINNYTYTKP